MLQIVHSGKEARHLVLAHHHGQLLGLLASRDVVLNNPRTLEGDGVEEPQGETVTMIELAARRLSLVRWSR